MGYDLYSKFDMEKHKKKYINYLEVIINYDGYVEYAIPSHQEKLIVVACNKLKVSREDLMELCPKEYYADFMVWLCKITGAISVWTEGVIYYEISKEQRRVLKVLKQRGIYKGRIY